MKRLFITGTGTDVGKTWVGTRLARHLSQSGLHVTACKPIESGCTGDEPTPKDASAYSRITKQTIEQICPYPLKAPLSPHQAMALEGKRIIVDDLHTHCLTQADADIQIIEGAGGVLSPIAADGTNRDLACQIGASIILVARNELGCLNHTLMSIEALEHHNLQLAAVVINTFSCTDFTQGIRTFLHNPAPIIYTHEKSWLTQLEQALHV